ncbi:MAG: Rpn family recombination-promoting nuclease/putative transposase [Gammaproteobacteria bacterium]
MTKHLLISFDWAMKKLLRSKANFGILEGFLSELLKQDLKILQLLESESNKNHHDDKQNRVDILVKLQSGEVVLIEVQVSAELDYFHRMLYGSSKIITDYMESGAHYDQIKKVYSINILYFDLGHGEDYIYHGTTKFVGLHKKDELSLSEKQKELYVKERPHELYPEYYLIKLNKFNDVAKNTLDEWIYFLKHEEIKDNFHAKGLLEAKDRLSLLKMTDAEKWEYDNYIKIRRIQTNEIQTGFYEGETKGRIEGKLEGEKIGLEKGERIGLVKGITQATRALARRLLAKGLAPEEVAELTELSKNAVSALQKEKH